MTLVNGDMRRMCTHPLYASSLLHFTIYLLTVVAVFIFVCLLF